MDIGEAVRLRILTLCEERHMNLNRLGHRCGLGYSTLSNIINGRNHSTTILTLERICEGLDISLSEFFDSDYFRDGLT